MDSAGNYELLIEKINLFIRKYYFNNFLRGLIFLGAGLFSAYVVIAVGEYFGNFSPGLRTLLFYFFIALNTGLICWLIIPSLLAWLKLGKSLTHDQAAEIIGRHFNDVNDKLLNTLQLKKLAAEDPQHRALIEASIDQKIDGLKPVSFPSAINIKENAKYLKWAIFPAGIICILAFAAPSVLTESTKRLIRHSEYFVPAAPFKFIVQNQTLSVVQGEDLKLDLKLEGNKLPADIYIETANNTFKLDKDNISRFHYLFTNLQQNTSFKLTGNGFTSAPYEIRVNLRPALLHFDAELTYPAYLHKKSETLLNAGDLTVPAGTLVNWTFHTQHATGLQFDMNGKTNIARSSTGDVFEYREKIYKNAVYKITPRNALVNHVDSASYRVNVIADEAPTMVVQEKQDSVSMKSVYFDGKIQDDHGFSSLIFHYQVKAASDKSTQRTLIKPVKADLSQTQANFFYFWNLNDLGIKSGDEITYYFEVADNDAVNGPKKVRSPERTLKLPDAKEINNELNAGTQVIKQKMESAIKIAGQIEHDSQKLNQLLLNKNTLSFDEKKQIEDLLQKRKELDDLVKEIQGDNKKNLYNRQENQQQDKQLTEKQQQMDELLNKVLDPKMQEMLQKLQELLQQEQKEGTRDELSKMQMDNKSLKKELDRMLELYKKLEFEQKLNQNVTQLNQLSKEQQKLAEQSKQAGTNTQELNKEQQKLNNDFQDVKESLDDLQKTNEQAEHKQDFEDPKKEEQSIEQQMNKSSDELKKNNPAKAAQSQQQAAEQMKQLASKMEQKEQEGEEAQNTVDAQQLRQLLKNLINSSFSQEKTMQAFKSTSPTDPNYIALAQTQKNIKDNLKTAEDSLYALSRRIPQIQSTVNQEVASINNHIDQALENLGDRRTAEATRNQQYAMTSMNNLALMLSEALDQLQNMMKKGKSGKGKGKQQSISQLSKMQQQLNQNMQKARGQLQQQGNQGKSQSGNNGGMSEQMARLARQQAMIRQALEQINKEDNKDGRGGLGNLDKISKEMEQTEHDLVNKRITEGALKRQEQIQTRLLEAEKAEQEREKDQQRESHAGKETPPGYIKALQEYKQLKEKQTEQVRTVPPAINFYYKSKIKSYFELLNAK
ncbi:MAG: ATPase [Mucilaginibacter sp.]